MVDVVDNTYDHKRLIDVIAESMEDDGGVQARCSLGVECEPARYSTPPHAIQLDVATSLSVPQ